MNSSAVSTALIAVAQIKYNRSLQGHVTVSCPKFYGFTHSHDVPTSPPSSRRSSYLFINSVCSSVYSVFCTFCSKPSFLRKSPLKLLKCHMHVLFMDARADGIHADFLKLESMKDKGLSHKLSQKHGSL